MAPVAPIYHVYHVYRGTDNDSVLHVQSTVNRSGNSALHRICSLWPWHRYINTMDHQSLAGSRIMVVVLLVAILLLGQTLPDSGKIGN